MSQWMRRRLPKVHASGPVHPGTASTPSERMVQGPSGPSERMVQGPDWAAETADRIDELVLTIRTNTTDRLVKVARVVVLGLLAAIMAVVAGILVTIALIRALDELVPGEVWIVYAILGAIFTIGGALLWSKRSPRRPKV